MKIIFTFLCCVGAFCTMAASKPTFGKLVELNKLWAVHGDALGDDVVISQQQSEQKWISLHLQLVERALRDKPVTTLTSIQKSRRSQMLDTLRSYWQAERFPVNSECSYRTPVFIDKQETFCAVGYLLKASGNAAISRMIAHKTNLAYVAEMKYPELEQWAAAYGFTKDELAWIQPSYPSTGISAPLGKGVNGAVYEMLADGDTLYVGGSFTKADSTITVNNIAFVTEVAGSYNWHSMGSGVNGAVHAIAKHNGRIYAAGTFTTAGGSAVHNIAWWDGGVWHPVAGCVAGIVKDLIVFNNDLYAAGHFTDCTSLSEVNFARLTDSGWEPLPGLVGRINTLEVKDSTLLIGGAFSYGNDTDNVIMWLKSDVFKKFVSGIDHEVNDFEQMNGDFYAIGSDKLPYDSSALFWTLQDNRLGDFYWFSNGLYDAWEYMQPINGEIALKTMCADNNGLLMVGGTFSYRRGTSGYSARYCIQITTQGVDLSGAWMNVNGGINKMLRFKNDLIFGGSFTAGTNYNGLSQSTAVVLNGIAKRDNSAMAVPGVAAVDVSVYPNPIVNNRELTIKGNLLAQSFRVMDITGRPVISGNLTGNTMETISLSGLHTGSYLLEVSNRKGEKVVKKIMIAN